MSALRRQRRVRRGRGLQARVRGSWSLVDGLEGSLPAGVGEEVGELMKGEAGPVGEAVLIDLAVGSFEGPVDEQGAADEVGAGDEAPVAAVEAVGAVVAHDEEAARRDDEVFTLDVSGEVEGPLSGDPGDVRGWDRGEVVAVGVVVGRGDFDSLGLALLDAVEVDDAVTEMDAVAGNTDDTFNEDEFLTVGFEDRFEEHNGFAALDVPAEVREQAWKDNHGGWQSELGSLKERSEAA